MPLSSARQRRGDRVEDLVVERVALRPGSRSSGGRPPRRGGRGAACPRQARSAARGLSRTTRTSPSWTDWPSSQRISETLPSSSTSTGISIFIDSRIDHRVAVGDLVADRDLDLPDGARDVRFDVDRHVARQNTRRAVAAQHAEPPDRHRRRPQRGRPHRRRPRRARGEPSRARPCSSPTTPPTTRTAEVARGARGRGRLASRARTARAGNVTGRRGDGDRRAPAAEAPIVPALRRRPRRFGGGAAPAGRCGRARRMRPGDRGVPPPRRGRLRGRAAFARGRDRAAVRLRAPRRSPASARSPGLDARPPTRSRRLRDGDRASTSTPSGPAWRIAEIELDLEHRATGRTLGGFIHRGRQLQDFRRSSGPSRRKPG